jgi:hypothetical protein
MSCSVTNTSFWPGMKHHKGMSPIPLTASGGISDWIPFMVDACGQKVANVSRSLQM